MPSGLKNFSYYLMAETRTPRANAYLSATGTAFAFGLQQVPSQIARAAGTAQEPSYAVTAAAAGGAGYARTHLCFQYLATSLQFDFTQSFAARVAGDSLPNYSNCNENLMVKDQWVHTGTGTTASMPLAQGARLVTGPPPDQIQAPRTAYSWYC